MITFYRHYQSIVISAVTVLCSFELGLPFCAVLVSWYSEIILVSSILQTVGLLLPICEFVLMYTIVDDSDSDEDWSEFYLMFLGIPIAIGWIIRLVTMILSWVYYSNPHREYISTIVLSSIASGAGLAIIISQLFKYYPGAKARAQRKIDYATVY